MCSDTRKVRDPFVVFLHILLLFISFLFVHVSQAAVRVQLEKLIPIIFLPTSILSPNLARLVYCDTIY